MDQQYYHCSFTVNKIAKEVFEAICQVSKWWTVNTEGSTDKLGAVFSIRFGETTATFKIIEMLPYQKIGWLVTDSHLHWLKDKSEWKHTQLSFEIKETEKGTTLNMVHSLQPNMECFENCTDGWNFYAGKSLYQLITAGKGMPDTGKEGR
jgi:hypothetical protein